MTVFALYILAIGALVQFSGTVAYLWNTIRGRAKPNRVTYFLWFLAPAIAVPAAIADGVGWTVLPVFMSGFGPLLIFLASFVNKNAYWKLNTLDYACGALSVLALVLWVITKEPRVAILFAILSDALAGWPTVLKAWRHPETEYFSAYAGSAFNAALVFVVAESYTFSSVAFPAYLIIVCGVILLGIFRGKLRHTRSV